MADDGNITVAVEAAGTEETREEIEKTEQQLEEAGEGMSETADEMEGLQQRLQGAGRTIAVAMAAAATGILSQIPVIGEVFAGLVAIFQSVMFQVDRLLRALGLGGLTGILFDISEAIFNLEGPLGMLVGLFGGVATAVLGVVGVAKTLGISLAPVVTAIKAVGAALLALEPITTAIIAIVAALIAAWVLFDDEIKAVVNRAISILQGLWNHIKSAVGTVESAINDVIGVINSIITTVTQAPGNAFNWFSTAIKPVQDAVEDVWDTLKFIGSWLAGGVVNALDWLLTPLQDAWDLVDDMWTTLKNKIDGTVFESVIDIALELLPDASAFPGIEDNNLGDVSGLDFISREEALNAGVPQDIVDQIFSNNTDSNQNFSADRTGGLVEIAMDGRTLTQQDGRYRRDGTARRFRNG
jgi:phage-related protein